MLTNMRGLWMGALAGSGLLLTGATAAPADGEPEMSVIVILRDQSLGAPPVREAMEARTSAVAAAQAPVLSELRSRGASRIRPFRIINAMAATMTHQEVERLATLASVRAIVPDRVLHARRAGLEDLVAHTSVGSAFGAPRPVNTSVVASQLCNTLEPEALQLTHAAFSDPSPAQAQRVRDGNGRFVTGEGVRVAYLADSLDPNVRGFVRPDGTPVFFDYQDFTGSPAGTPTIAGEAFGDASSIAAQDMPNGVPLLFDISQFVNPAHPLPSPCNIRIRGMAPGASLAGMQFLDTAGVGLVSAAVQAIEWAVIEDKVDVINESFGFGGTPDSDMEPLTLANAAAVRAGVTVIVSSADSGPGNTIANSAASPDVITVGATTQNRVYAQVGAIVGRGYLDNNIAYFSSGGLAFSRARTVDVVAPGDASWALCSPSLNLYFACESFAFGASPIEFFNGTSESAPLTAGLAALVIQAYRSTHGGANPSPALVKQIIMSTATDLGAPSSEQGAGLINALAAVNAALSVSDANGHPVAKGDNLLIAPGSAVAIDAPGTLITRSFEVTNIGTRIQHLAPTLETLGAPIAGEMRSLTLNPAADSTFFDFVGRALPFIEQRFSVPVGTRHLDATLAYPNSPTSFVTVFLIDPEGRQINNRLGGAPDGGYHVEVDHPSPGIWTAVIFTGVLRSIQSYSGPVTFAWSAQSDRPFGEVTPSELNLRPGERAILTARFQLPANPGDRSARIRLRAAGAENETPLPDIPVSLRTLVPLGRGGGDFSGALVDNDGRGPQPSQTFDFDIPAHSENLSVGVQIADSTASVTGFLIDPHGMALSVATNRAAAGTLEPTLQLFRYDPEPGRWHVILKQDLAVSARPITVPVSGKVSFYRTREVVADPLPHDPAVRFSASAGPILLPVTVTNNGVATKAYFVDARLSAPRAIQRTVNSFCNGTTIPGVCGLVLIPPETSFVQFTGSSSAPLTMDVFGWIPFDGSFPGAQDLWGRAAGPNTVLASLSTAEVPFGFWELNPAPVGPFGAAGAAAASFTARAVTVTQPFDPSISADTTDQWATQIEAPNRLVLEPGQSGTIQVTLTPDPSQIGRTVEGYLYVDTFSDATQTGDEVVRIPYRYTVGP